MILHCGVLTHLIPPHSKFILHLIPATTSNSKAPSSYLVFSLLTFRLVSKLKELVNSLLLILTPVSSLATKQLGWPLKNKNDHTTTSFKILPDSNEHRIHSELLHPTKPYIWRLLSPSYLIYPLHSDATILITLHLVTLVYFLQAMVFIWNYMFLADAVTVSRTHGNSMKSGALSDLLLNF